MGTTRLKKGNKITFTFRRYFAHFVRHFSLYTPFYLILRLEALFLIYGVISDFGIRYWPFSFCGYLSKSILEVPLLQLQSLKMTMSNPASSWRYFFRVLMETLYFFSASLSCFRSWKAIVQSSYANSSLSRIMRSQV